MPNIMIFVEVNSKTFKLKYFTNNKKHSSKTKIQLMIKVQEPSQSNLHLKTNINSI